MVLFLVDARAARPALDLELAAMLRRLNLSVPLLVANKVDSERSQTRVLDLHALGLGVPLEVSAEHGLGVAELVDAVLATRLARGRGASERGSTAPERGDRGPAQRGQVLDRQSPSR